MRTSDTGACALVSSYGVRVALRGSDSAALYLLLDGLPGRWKPANGASRARRVYSLTRRPRRRPRFVLYRDDTELVNSDDPDRVRELFIGSVGFYVAESARTRTFVHAGVVGWRGRAIVVPGRQGSGKTTLTAALVRAGATYLSDEYAPLDDRGFVDPFVRPLSVRQPDGESVRLHEVEALGGVRETRKLPVGLVVVAPFTGVSRWRPRRLPPGEAVLELLAHTVTAQTNPRQALDRLGALAVAATVVKGSRGDADQTAHAILTRVGTLSAGVRSG